AITMTSPCATWKPRRSAAPYPGVGSTTTRAPAERATSADPSVELLSTTITSPQYPAEVIASNASRTHAPTVAASLRHGSTTLTPPPCAPAMSAGCATIRDPPSYHQSRFHRWCACLSRVEEKHTTNV